MTGGLFDPLGTDRAEVSRRPSRPPASIVVAGLILLAFAVLLAAAWFRDDGDRGRPLAVAPIEHIEAPPKPATPPAAPTAAPSEGPPSAAEPGLPAIRSDQEVEIQNGVRIVRPRRGGPSSGSQTLQIPDATAPR